MAHIKDRAIILRPLDFSETSQVLVALTREHGKQRFIAKGIKRSTSKRFAPAVDVLDVGDVVWSSRGEGRSGLLTLTEWTQCMAHVGLRDRLQRLYPALYAGEVTSEMVQEGDPHPELFEAMVGLLEQLVAVDDGLAVLCDYLKTLLDEAGLLPEFNCCVCCGCVPGADRIYFSSHEGGLVCRDCEPARVEKRLMTRAQLAALIADHVADADARSVFELLDYHFSHLLGKPLRLSAFLLPERAARR